jgi:dCTP deaminase
MLTQKHRVHGVSHGLAEAGYDIRLKQDIKFFPKEGIVSLRHDEYHVPIETKGRFVLASAIEEFDMPADLVGVVHDKSTWARQGVSVFNTVIEPGWKGFLTLEIVFHGQDRVHLPAGAGIAQVLFHKLSEPAEYSGKYQNQADKPVESKWEK